MSNFLQNNESTSYSRGDALANVVPLLQEIASNLGGGGATEATQNLVLNKLSSIFIVDESIENHTLATVNVLGNLITFLTNILPHMANNSDTSLNRLQSIIDELQNSVNSTGLIAARLTDKSTEATLLNVLSAINSIGGFNRIVQPSQVAPPVSYFNITVPVGAKTCFISNRSASAILYMYCAVDIPSITTLSGKFTDTAGGSGDRNYCMPKGTFTINDLQRFVIIGFYNNSPTTTIYDITFS